MLELVPPYQILYADLQFSHCLLFALLDVCQVFISGLPERGALLEATSKGLEHLVCILLVFLRQLVLQGCSYLRSLFATKEQDMYHLVYFGSVGNHEVLLQPLLVEGPGNKLVPSIIVHVGKHVWYSSCHSASLPV